MVLERYRSGWEATLAPAARSLRRWGVTPNTITAASFLFAILAAAAFLLATRERLWMLLVASAAISVNAILDGLDGRLARLTNTTSVKGDYLDHVVDRYSDIVILAGLAFSPLGDVRWGFFAIVGTLLTSYMGTQAQALGLGRMYAGFLGRADRLVILLAVPALVFLVDLAGVAVPWQWNPLVLMLAYFAIVGNLTAVQRFWSGWRALDAPPPKP